MKITRKDHSVTVDLPGVGQLKGEISAGERCTFRAVCGSQIANFYTDGYARTANVGDRLYSLASALRKELGRIDAFIEFTDGRVTYLPASLPDQPPPWLVRGPA